VTKILKGLSIVIPTKNSSKTIERLIESILNQRGIIFPFEIVIVDNFSDDSTRQLVDKFSSALISFYEFGPERSQQRNFGIEKSKYCYIGYIDSDMQLSENLLKIIYDDFEKNKSDAIKVPEIIIGKSFLNGIRRYERVLYEDSFIDSPRFIKKTVLEQLGGFKPGIPGAEDWELDSRLISLNAKTKFLRIASEYKKYKSNLYNVEGLYHDETDLNFATLLKKKAYYKKADIELIENLKQSSSPMLNVFSVSYRIKLLFSKCIFFRGVESWKILFIIIYRIIIMIKSPKLVRV